MVEGCKMIANETPLGLRPHAVWLQLRSTEIAAAIESYMEAGKAVPADWIHEWSNVLGELGDIEDEWRENNDA